MSIIIKSSKPTGGQDSQGRRFLLLSMECDSAADLPAPDYFGSSADVLISMGSDAHTIAENAKYMLNSSGSWVLQEAGSAAYTKAEVDAMISAAISSAVSETNDLILGLGTRLPDTGIDANDYDQPGVYRMQTTAGAALSSNVPRTDLAYKLRVELINNTNRVLQTFIPLLSSAAIYRRSKTSAGWQAWYIVQGVQV